MTLPHLLTEVLPIPLFQAIFDEFEDGWKLNNYANIGDGTKSWGRAEKNLLVFHEAASIVKLKIMKVLRRPVKLCKIHCNAQTQCQGAFFHTDFKNPEIWTFVLFTQRSWNTEWGGEFVCYNPNKEAYDFIPYIPNTGVLIPSCWEHVGRSPIQTQELRTSIAFSYVAIEHADNLFKEVPGLNQFL